jgi:hypothetical protein
MSDAPDKFKISWIDHGREPQCAPNPAYPDGIDVVPDLPAGTPTCKIVLPYPARRCGAYMIVCCLCDNTVMVTTAGRPDDPRSVVIPCLMSGTKQ